MKAVTYDEFGPPEVLRFTEVQIPKPSQNQVLVKVKASTVNAADCNVRGLTYIPPGLGFVAKMMLGRNNPKFKILGSVYAGEVVAVGNWVTSFKVGDRVFGSHLEMGAYAEYVCKPAEGALTLMPENISFEEAATVPYGGLTALYFLKTKAQVSPGQKVLVIGASGGVGVYAVQLAKHFGAEVTAVCSGSNAEFVRTLGADSVIDYKKEDITRSGEKFDAIFAVAVGKSSFPGYKKLLNQNGYYLAVAGGLPDMIQGVRTTITGGRQVVFGGGAACETKEAIEFLKEGIEKGELKPVLDRTFPLDEIIEAHRYVESGSKKGNIAVSIP